MAKRVIKIFGWTLNKSDVPDDIPFYAKTKETLDTPDAFVIKEGESIVVDAHNDAIRSVQEVGGRCICGKMLCRDCAQIRCCLDQKSLCCDHWEIVNGRYVCSEGHSWGELLKVAFMPELPDPRAAGSAQKQLPPAR